MKIFLIIDETYFYQPEFVADLIRKSNYEFVGAALITKVLEKSDINNYIIKHWYYLTLSEILKLKLKKISFVLRNCIKNMGFKSGFYSVKSVFKYFDIDFFPVEYNINQAPYLEKIEAKKPDVIISSNSLIFGERLLKIPKYCINRHSALLPSYGGLWPVFQALRNNEKFIGVTVHTMGKEIDKGEIICQEKIEILPCDTVDSLYQKCFKISASVTIKALEFIKSDINPIKANYPASYYSFPKKQHWKEFRKRKLKFI